MALTTHISYDRLQWQTIICSLNCYPPPPFNIYIRIWSGDLFELQQFCSSRWITITELLLFYQFDADWRNMGRIRSTHCSSIAYRWYRMEIEDWEIKIHHLVAGAKRWCNGESVADVMDAPKSSRMSLYRSRPGWSSKFQISLTIHIEVQYNTDLLLWNVWCKYELRFNVTLSDSAFLRDGLGFDNNSCKFDQTKNLDQISQIGYAMLINPWSAPYALDKKTTTAIGRKKKS